MMNKNTKDFITKLKKDANQGIPEAQYRLGYYYYCGAVVRKSKNEAIKWWLKAAEQDNAKAQFHLACCYIFDQDFSQNKEEGMSWLNKAAEKGYMFAQFNLGKCYLEGNGIKQNKIKAVEWYRKAAAQGLVIAQYYLGQCYEEGEGVEKDIQEAEEWFLKASEQGYDDALEKIIYYNKKIEHNIKARFEDNIDSNIVIPHNKGYYGLDCIDIYQDIEPCNNSEKNCIKRQISSKNYSEKLYAIAFIDLLGSTKKIQENINGNPLKTISKIYHKVIEYLEQLKFHNIKPSWRIFSDNILIVAPIHKNDEEEFFYAFYIVFISTLLFQASAMDYGWPLRGGIIIDKFYIDDILVWGRGLVKAYELENKYAINPRIIISKELEIIAKKASEKIIRDIPELKGENQYLVITKGCDDYYYLNYQLCYYLLVKQKTITGLVLFSHLEKFLLSEINKKYDEKTHNKYLWLIKTHNEWCERNNIDHKIDYKN